MNLINVEHDELLEKGRIFLENVDSDVVILELLAPFGAADAEFERGRGLHAEAGESVIDQRQERTELAVARAELRSLHAEGLQDFVDDVELARMALKQPSERWLALRLHGSIRRTLTGLLAEGPRFYQLALEDTEAQPQLARRGLTVERLQAHQGRLSTIEQKQAQVYAEAAEAKEATRRRDVAMDDFAEWLGDMTQIARIALRSRPDLLAKLGLA
jgi:hypothetical protein